MGQTQYLTAAQDLAEQQQQLPSSCESGYKTVCVVFGHRGKGDDIVQHVRLREGKLVIISSIAQPHLRSKVSVSRESFEVAVSAACDGLEDRHQVRGLGDMPVHT